MSITTVLEPLSATLIIDHFTVVCLTTWPLNGFESCFDTDLTAFVVQIKLFLCQLDGI